MIGCSSQVTSVKATPPVVSIGRPVEDVDAADETKVFFFIQGDMLPVHLSTCHPVCLSHLSSSLKSQYFLFDGPLREAGLSLSITQDAVRVRGS